MAAASQHDEATRARLLKAAAEVFAEAGFAASTVRGICARAQVNVAAVNYHFGDKLGLYTEVLKQSAGPGAQRRIRDAMAGAVSPEDALRIFVRGMFDKVYGANPETNVKIMTQEIINPTPAFESIVDETMRPQYKQLCAIVSSITGHAQTSMETKLGVYSLVGQILHYFHGREVIARLTPTMNIAKERNRIADHIVNFTLAGLTASKRV
jgi:TetR/AcrR family transcriptional regulator, regulator of cefoperazone and chloramphenicol sensitivity